MIPGRPLKMYACFEFPKRWAQMKDPDFISRARTRIFGHCYVIVPLNSETCLILDKTTQGFFVRGIQKSAIDLVGNLVNNGVQVCEVPVKREINRSLELFTCTGFVKKILNVKKFWILTPRQLWRHFENERSRIPSA